MVCRDRVIDYRLVDVPELGYLLTDRPYPRGELLVRTDTMTPGYYNRPEITAGVFDDDGYYRTGDVVAEIEPGRLAYIDRRSNVLKLAQGESVAVTSLEAVYTGAPLIRQIFVYCTGDRSNLLAVVVPTLVALAEYGNSPSTKSGLAPVAGSYGGGDRVQSYEMPVDFLIETKPFTDENGLLSGAGKLLRPRLEERYGEWLEQMHGHRRRAG